MINLKIDEEALGYGIVSLCTHDNVEIDEELSDRILLKTPCYDLAVSKNGELVELECDVEDWEKLDPFLFRGFYSFEGKSRLAFSEVFENIKEKISTFLI